MINIDKHLDSDEELILKCRPTRRAFLPEYLLIIIVILLSMILGYYKLTSWLNTQYNLAAVYTIMLTLTVIIALILILKVEYKIWSKRYALTNERIMISTGIFSENFTSTIYIKITDIGLKQSFFDKILNVGKVTLNTAGGDDVEIVLENISKPFELKKTISDQQTSKNNALKEMKKKII